MARVEQESAPHPMQELPKGEVVFSKQLTLRELLNLSTEESDPNNSQYIAPFNFQTIDLGRPSL